jgi:hypothetical protein
MSRILPDIILERRKHMTRVDVSCHGCDAETVLMEAALDKNNLPYFVFECTRCNVAWRTTEPTIVERLLAAKWKGNHD